MVPGRHVDTQVSIHKRLVDDTRPILQCTTICYPDRRSHGENPHSNFPSRPIMVSVLVPRTQSDGPGFRTIGLQGPVQGVGETRS